jgi:hypothetical protein
MPLKRWRKERARMEILFLEFSFPEGQETLFIRQMFLDIGIRSYECVIGSVDTSNQL